MPERLPEGLLAEVGTELLAEPERHVLHGVDPNRIDPFADPQLDFVLDGIGKAGVSIAAGRIGKRIRIPAFFGDRKAINYQKEDDLAFELRIGMDDWAGPRPGLWSSLVCF